MAENPITTIQLKRRVVDSKVSDNDLKSKLADGEPLLDQKNNKNHLFIKSNDRVIEFPNITTVENKVDNAKDDITGTASDSSDRLTLHGVKNYTTLEISKEMQARTQADNTLQAAIEDEAEARAAAVEAEAEARADAISRLTTTKNAELNHFITGIEQEAGIITNIQTEEVKLIDSKVELSSELYLTQNLGRLTPAMNPVGKKNDGTLMTIRELLEDAFCYSTDSSLISSHPKYTFSVSNPEQQQVGSTSTVTATFTATDGSYTYGRWENGKANFNNKEMGVSYTTPANLSASVTFKDISATQTISTNTTRKKATYSPINSKGIEQEIPDPYGEDSDSITLSTTFNVPAGWRYKFYYSEPAKNGLSITSTTQITDILKNCTKTSQTSVNFTAQKGVKAVYLIQPSATKPTIKYKEMGNFVEFLGFDDGVELQSTIGAPISTSGTTNPTNNHISYYVFKYTPSNNSLAADTEFQVTFKA